MLDRTLPLLQHHAITSFYFLSRTVASATVSLPPYVSYIQPSFIYRIGFPVEFHPRRIFSRIT